MKFMNVWKGLLALAFLAGIVPTATMAQYTRTDLITGPTPDAQLVNGWGLVQLVRPGSPPSPFWVSDNGTGLSTLYTGTGLELGLIVTVPPAPGGSLGSPTGVVGNISTNPSDFVVTNGVTNKSGASIFIFATLDGIIAGWNPGVGGTNATRWVDRSGVGASYSGLAIATDPTSHQTFLFAADDSANRRIDRFDGSKNVMSFSDPEIPRNYAPYGIQEIDGPSGPQIWVTFTALNKAQGGFVDVFNIDGSVAQHFAVHGPLHSPWGIAKAPADFGPMSGAILISNNTSRGRVNAFDASGNFLGPLRDANGNAIEIDNVWAIQFGHDGGPGGTPHNSLFFTAGPNTYSDGLFGVITPGN